LKLLLALSGSIAPDEDQECTKIVAGKGLDKITWFCQELPYKNARINLYRHFEALPEAWTAAAPPVFASC
jgi:hypothetical protein